MKRIAVLLAFCGLCSTAQAAPFDCGSVRPDPQRNPDAIKYIDVGLAAVTGSEKVHFSNCPGEGCSVDAYVMPGDAVVTGETRPDWVCALFPNKRGGTKGWLPVSRVKTLPIAADPPLAAWAGKWKMHDDANIEIKIEGDTLAVSGEAFWYRNAAKGAHIGEIEGKAKPVHGIVRLRSGDAEYGCKADLRLVGPYLVVEESGCGGLNVSFNGAYRRQGP